jgi:hypothetical protein
MFRLGEFTSPPPFRGTRAHFARIRLEKGKVDSRVSTLTAIEKVLTKAGIDFLPAGDRGEGVRLRSPRI